MGQIDLKADRKKKTLLVKNLVWESTAQKSQGFISAFRKKLNELMLFNNCEEMHWEAKAESAVFWEI